MEANVESQKQKFRIAKARQEAGLVSFLDVLEAERQFVLSKQSASQVRRAKMESSAQLYVALGGGVKSD